jgi:hypothetical protein
MEIDSIQEKFDFLEHSEYFTTDLGEFENGINFPNFKVKDDIHLNFNVSTASFLRIVSMF